MNRSMIFGAGALALATAIAGFGGGYMVAQRTGSSEVAGSTAPQERKVLYYRNPMGLPDTSPVPKKDPMGMDYIPVYADKGLLPRRASARSCTTAIPWDCRTPPRCRRRTPWVWSTSPFMRVMNRETPL